MKKIRLEALAFARSGDKGDVSNIGIMARTKNIYDFLSKALTPELIRDHFRGMIKGDVEIYLLPNIESIEVVLRQALGGGATCTLRFDQTGKSMGQALLRLELEVEEELLEEARAVDREIRDRYAVG
jgi:hypothetical protein